MNPNFPKHKTILSAVTKKSPRKNVINKHTRNITQKFME